MESLACGIRGGGILEANGLAAEKPCLSPRVSMLSAQPFRKHLAKELRNARVLLGSPDTRLARDVLRKGDGHIPHGTILVQHGFRVKKNPTAVA
jgi:hypothetical protein